MSLDSKLDPICIIASTPTALAALAAGQGYAAWALRVGQPTPLEANTHGRSALQLQWAEGKPWSLCCINPATGQVTVLPGKPVTQEEALKWVQEGV